MPAWRDSSLLMISITALSESSPTWISRGELTHRSVLLASNTKTAVERAGCSTSIPLPSATFLIATTLTENFLRRKPDAMVVPTRNRSSSNELDPGLLTGVRKVSRVLSHALIHNYRDGLAHSQRRLFDRCGKHFQDVTLVCRCFSRLWISIEYCLHKLPSVLEHFLPNLCVCVEKMGPPNLTKVDGAVELQFCAPRLAATREMKNSGRNPLEKLFAASYILHCESSDVRVVLCWQVMIRRQPQKVKVIVQESLITTIGCAEPAEIVQHILKNSL
ncbi:hypothetical protein BJ742DRAFT_363594 [Cladochytrium replicatum]|nr:hypothetical protein BJ742DRAFT_363594 [Cladochytrium replicatum]